jgi:hypothetical protein
MRTWPPQFDALPLSLALMALALIVYLILKLLGIAS